MSNYKRAFIFGCSYTKYRYPTWADMLATQVDFPVLNLGIPGIGNVGILYEMLKNDITHRFDDRDLIIVMWTHWSREDRYIDNRWTSFGNVFTGGPESLYNESFRKKYWSWDNDIIKNSSSILLANRSFRIIDQFSILNYGDPEYPLSIEDRKESNLYDCYINVLPKIKVFDDSNNSMFSGTAVDSHPDILCHMEFYNKLAQVHELPKIEPESVYHRIQKDLIDLLKHKKDFSLQCELIEKYFYNFKEKCFA